MIIKKKEKKKQPVASCTNYTLFSLQREVFEVVAPCR